MNRAALLLLCCLLATPARANECEDAAHAAERTASLPTDLITAIGRVESGRRSPDGHVAPWPWSVNAAGRGYYLPSLPAALDLVRGLRAQGIQSIDVGCFQVNLLYHPEAFTSLEDAFDPRSNARAAAAFLTTLRAAASGLQDAIGRYHSADPARGQPYAQQVMASWHGGADMRMPPISQVAALVRVFVPGGSAAGLMPAFTTPSFASRVFTSHASPGRLPVVIVPTTSRS